MAGSFNIIALQTFELNEILNRLLDTSFKIQAKFIVNKYVTFKEFWNRKEETRTSLMSVRVVIEKQYSAIEDERESLLLNVRSKENQSDGFLIENNYKFKNSHDKRWYILTSNNEWESNLCLEFCYHYLNLNKDHYIMIEGSDLLINYIVINRIVDNKNLSDLNANWPWENYTKKIININSTT